MFGSSRKGLRLADDERGATDVEFAIVAPVMLMMLFGIFQFGWTQHSLPTCVTPWTKPPARW